MFNSFEKATYTDQYSFCLKAIARAVFKICLFFISLYYIVFCLYIDNINEKNWQKVVMNMLFCQYFVKILCIKVYCIFILKNLTSNLAKVFLVSLEVSVNLPAGLICIFA